MDADNSQVEAKPLIEANLGDNGGQVSFDSIEAARGWAGRELRQWEKFASQIDAGPPVHNVLRRQLELPTKIEEALNDAEEAQVSDQPKALEQVKQLFERYADYGSLYSRSPLGVTLLDMDGGRHPWVKLGGLASTIGIPAEDILDSEQPADRQASMILAGYAIGMGRSFVKRSDIPDLRSRLDEELSTMAETVARTEKEREETSNLGKRTTDQLQQQREAQESAWNAFHESADEEWKSLKRTFEEHLRLEAPATYWQERARTTFSAAMWSLGAFVALASGFIWVVVVHGPQFLKELPSPEDIGNFGTLTMLSIPALTALWILRHFGRLFVTNFERSGDARMRQTMATTFLALTKEGTEAVTQEERLMVLQALFRAPAETKGDEGHFGSALDILSRKNPQN